MNRGFNLSIIFFLFGSIVFGRQEAYAQCYPTQWAPGLANYYAQQHWNDDPDIPGNDCANFVSKCLRNGNLQLGNPKIGGLDFRYHTDGTYTYVPDLVDYLFQSKQGVEVNRNGNLNCIQQGDVAITGGTGPSGLHAIIICQVDIPNRRISYYGHTRRRNCEDVWISIDSPDLVNIIHILPTFYIYPDWNDLGSGYFAGLTGCIFGSNYNCASGVNQGNHYRGYAQYTSGELGTSNSIRNLFLRVVSCWSVGSQDLVMDIHHLTDDNLPPNCNNLPGNDYGTYPVNRIPIDTTEIGLPSWACSDLNAARQQQPPAMWGMGFTHEEQGLNTAFMFYGCGFGDEKDAQVRVVMNDGCATPLGPTEGGGQSRGALPRYCQGEKEVLLEEAHPNPTGEGVTIYYYMPSSGYVALKVFNITGQLVSTLIEGEVSSGGHRATWK